MRLRTGLIAAVCTALGLGCGVFLFAVWGQPAPVVVQLGDAAPAGGRIRVYVSGAVRQPGVYALQQGDRVVEAVEAAGGPAADADTESLNFAERVVDAEHLHVPRIGEPTANPQTAQPSLSTQGAELVDINRADVNLLRSLPGVGATRAANIVASREKDGPFQRPEDLIQRKLLTQSLYDQVKGRITAGP